MGSRAWPICSSSVRPKRRSDVSMSFRAHRRCPRTRRPGSRRSGPLGSPSAPTPRSGWCWCWRSPWSARGGSPGSVSRSSVLWSWPPSRRSSRCPPRPAGMSEQLAAADRIFAILDARPAVDDPAGALGRGCRRHLRGAVELRGVSFSYPGCPSGPRWVISTLEIGRRPPGRGGGAVGLGKVDDGEPARTFLGSDAGRDPARGQAAVATTLSRPFEPPSACCRSGLISSPGPSATISFSLRRERIRPISIVPRLRRISSTPSAPCRMAGRPGSASTGLQLSGGQRRRLALARLLLQRSARRRARRTDLGPRPCHRASGDATSCWRSSTDEQPSSSPIGWWPWRSSTRSSSSTTAASSNAGNMLS